MMLLASAAPAAAQTFLPDDPLLEDPDRLDMPPPQPQRVSEVGDFLKNTMGWPGEYEGPALNANTIGEMPNSSWYTRRHVHERLSLEALRRGPNRMGAPEAPWQVTGIEQGEEKVRLAVTDARGHRYTLSFDPEGHRELATGAAAVSARLLYALGYNVPEHHIVHFQPDQLAPAEESDVTQSDMRAALEQVPRTADGRRRALAVGRVEGEPLGPFLYWSTRADDGNDIFPHEGRRELRGLRAIAAWINHAGARSENSLDVLVREDGRRFVRHYLTGLSATLGAGTDGPKERWMGHEYMVTFWPAFWRAWTLGWAGSEWSEADYPSFSSIGHIEAEGFDPAAWVPQYPNPAFLQADGRDLFWAARQIMHFTGDEIRAAVSAGAYTDPAAERYLAETLIKRRERIGMAFLPFGGGLDGFRVQGDVLVYTDLLVRHGIRTLAAEQRARGTGRVATWHTYDNEAEETGRFLMKTGATPQAEVAEAVPLPASGAAFLEATIHTPPLGRTHVFLRRTEQGYAVVGLARFGLQEGRKVGG